MTPVRKLSASWCRADYVGVETCLEEDHHFERGGMT
jgi:hypothetical protein